MTIVLYTLIFGYIATMTLILVASIVVERKRKDHEKRDASKLEEKLAQFREILPNLTRLNDLRFVLECRFPISFYANRFDRGHELHDILRAIAETKHKLEGRGKA
jgi:hypothetical protein